MWQSGICDICANIKTLGDYKKEKYIYNEQNGLWYELQGDYYLPCLVLEEEDIRKYFVTSKLFKQSMATRFVCLPVLT